MTRPFRIGLTGSIGMGKSTTAALFAEEGVPVWDADAAVHRLYSRGGAAVGPLSGLFPEAVIDDEVDRGLLRSVIAADPGALRQIEEIVHPLVAEDRESFLDATVQPLVLLDIPLLFETGGESEVDHVVVVSAPEDVQRDRVLARPGMSEARFAAMLEKQLSDAQKKARADDIVRTVTLDEARAQVRDILRKIRERLDIA